ncbi:hypothetical protein AMECASPLE_017071 [Ameca splendens]|uniref:Uncharacterized protein n=1 Tax=Ameca splendens TaxID=208324 RepID=A0ABV0ZMG6_9TELE
MLSREGAIALTRLLSLVRSDGRIILLSVPVKCVQITEKKRSKFGLADRLRSCKHGAMMLQSLRSDRTVSMEVVCFLCLSFHSFIFIFSRCITIIKQPPVAAGKQ